MNRNRLVYIILIIITLLIGIASRKFPQLFLSFLADYLGDTLWALLVFWLLGFLFTRKSTFNIAILALAFSYFIEISQLYHASWIDTIRNTTICALVLGHGFLWSDLICYTVGISFGVFVEFFFLKQE